MSENRTAVGIVRRDDGRLLCVWNKRYGGWGFPGGKVEEGETVPMALVRELREETSLHALSWRQVYEGPHKTKPQEGTEGRGSIVHVFFVTAYLGDPKEQEIGSPVTWLTREEFLRWTPFREFYEGVSL